MIPKARNVGIGRVVRGQGTGKSDYELARGRGRHDGSGQRTAGRGERRAEFKSHTVGTLPLQVVVQEPG